MLLLVATAAVLMPASGSDGALRGTNVESKAQPKILCSAEDVIGQFSWDGMYSTQKECKAELDYTISNACSTPYGPNEVYGLVVKNEAAKGSRLYPEFIAVTWASDHDGLGHWLGASCNHADSLEEAICNILPSTVGLDKGSANGVAVFNYNQLKTSAESYKLVSPTWMNLFSEKVMQHTYDYVFSSFKDKFADFDKFKATCAPAKPVFSYLDGNGPAKQESGLKAYNRILEDVTFGAQMREVNCNNKDVSDWVGACRCQSNDECNQAVEHFCGADYHTTNICDPSPYLCPSDGTNPVGYVRAYLEYFLDAVPAFRGTGYGEADGEDGEPEYFVSPNILENEPGVYKTDKVQCPQ